MWFGLFWETLGMLIPMVLININVSLEEKKFENFGDDI
jgi:hypothetical protein